MSRFVSWGHLEKNCCRAFELCEDWCFAPLVSHLQSSRLKFDQLAEEAGQISNVIQPAAAQRDPGFAARRGIGECVCAHR